MALFILLCNDEKQENIREIIAEAKEEIDNGELPCWSWSCGNTKKIQAGDRILFQRTVSEPHGWYAYGVAVEAIEEYQLRLSDEKYRDLSEVYITDFYGSSFCILVEIHSVVDYDYPLEKAKVKSMAEFQGISFHFQSGGCEIKPDSIADALCSEWEKHSMELSRKGFGRRIIDIYCESAHELFNQGEYQEAIEVFEGALTFDPEYTKAKNGIKKCLAMLQKKSTANTAPTPAEDINSEESIADIDNTNSSEDANIAISKDDSETSFYGNSENNRKVEIAAINFVTQFYEADGWSVTSVERDKVGYDLVCKKGDERLDVEVKGRSGKQPEFVITKNELVQATENPAFVLCVVTSATSNPVLQRWTGSDMLQVFNFEPLAYRASLIM